jgi:hypothetical protein
VQYDSHESIEKDSDSELLLGGFHDFPHTGLDAPRADAPGIRQAPER